MIEDVERGTEAIHDCLEGVRKNPQKRAHELVELLEDRTTLISKFNCIEVTKNYGANQSKYQNFCKAYIIYLINTFISDPEDIEIMLVALNCFPAYEHEKRVTHRRAQYVCDVYGPRHPEKRCGESTDNKSRNLYDQEQRIISELSDVLAKLAVKQGGTLNLIEDVLTATESNEPKEVGLLDDASRDSALSVGDRKRIEQMDVPDKLDEKPEDAAIRGSTSNNQVDPKSEYDVLPPPTETKSSIWARIFKNFTEIHNVDARKIGNFGNITVIIGSRMPWLMLFGFILIAVFCWVAFCPSSHTDEENVNPKILVQGQIIQAQNVIVVNNNVDRVMEYVSSDPDLITVTANGLLVVQEGQPGEASRAVDVTMRGESGATETQTFEIDFSQEGFDLPEGNIDDYAPSFRVEQRVRLAGTDEWKTNIQNAKVGDKIEFRILYTNISDEVQNSVMIKNVLPKNLAYIPSTTILTNAAYTLDINQDDLVTDGINIGHYEPGANAYVDFTAVVVDNILQEGTNNLVNWSQCGVGQVTLQDYATIQVYKGG